MASNYVNPTPVASGATFTQLQNNGFSGHLEYLLTKQVATVAPTAAATATATGGGSTGGSLAAGTYYFVFTETNGFGETTISPEGSQLTVGSTNIPQFTFPSLKTGNVARNLYLGALNGSSGGPYTLYAGGITTTTYNASAAQPTGVRAVAPPTANSTALNGKMIELIRSGEDGRLMQAYRRLRETVDGFCHGKPMTNAETEQRFREAHATFEMLVVVCREIAALIDQNPGTLGFASTGIQGIAPKRTWP